jgi:DNA ligase-1
LFEESYQAVGDLAETISLILPDAPHVSSDGLATWIESKLLPLRGESPDVLALRLPELWSQLDRTSLMLCIKLITGSFRVGVSKLLVTRALAAMAHLDSKRVAQRLVGYTDLSNRPSAASYLKLIAAESADEHAQRGGQPYPFFLAHALSQPVEQFEVLLGPASHWQVEWKWDGIRAQVVKRAGQLWVWSRGEELVTERFPELGNLIHGLPDGTVIDGEIVVWKGAQPDTEDAFDPHSPTGPAVQPFALLQQRIGRKTLSKKMLSDLPVVVLAYDLLEWAGEDWRNQPQSQRRAQLEQVIAHCNHPALLASPLLTGDDWFDLARQREASRQPWGRRHDAQGSRRTLWRGSNQGHGRVVEMESRPVQRRRRTDLCTTRSWTPSQPLQRLHLRGLGRPAATPANARWCPLPRPIRG